MRRPQNRTRALLVVVVSVPVMGVTAATLPHVASPAAPADQVAVADEAGPAPELRRPELPRAYLDTTLVTASGRVIHVAPDNRLETALNSVLRAVGFSPGRRLQAALNAARPGDVIELSAGSEYVGNFVLPHKSGTEWITIRSSAHTQLPPPGARVAPTDAASMPKVIGPNWYPAVRTAAGAHHFRLVGLEITTTWATREGQIHAVVDLSGSSNITIDRSYIHGTPTGNVRTGILANGASIAVVGSYLSDFHHVTPGYDAAAIWAWDGPGPFKIVNNYLESSGVNLFFGGSDPTIANLVPADIEIRGNLFSKPLTWREGDPSYAGIRWNVKNLFELKNARRVLVDGNVFEQNWSANQHGFAIVFTPRNQKGTAPWSVVEDVTFTNNVVRRATAGIAILGWDYNRQSEQAKRILIRNNLFTDIGIWPSYDAYWTGTLVWMEDGAADVVIDHNTALQTGRPLTATARPGRATAHGFVFTNNITPSGSGDILQMLNTYFPDWTFARNVLVGGRAALFPPGNLFPASLSQVGFVDVVHDDYRLDGRSPYRGAATDGKDIGADIDAILGATRFSAATDP